MGDALCNAVWERAWKATRTQVEGRYSDLGLEGMSTERVRAALGRIGVRGYVPATGFSTMEVLT